MEDQYEYTVPLDDTLALESPIAESWLLNLDMDTEVVDLCETVQDSEDEMEDHCANYFVMDSEDGVEQNEAESMVNEECCVIRKIAGRDATGLAKRGKVPAGHSQSLGNTFRANIHLASTKISDDRSKIGSIPFDNDSRHEDGVVHVGCLESREPDQKGIFRNAQKLHLHQQKSNMVTAYWSRNSLNEKRFSFNKSKVMNTGKVVNYDCDCEYPKLSYIESPEPADLQGKALNFVDHYLEISDLGFSTLIENRKTNRITSPPSLRSKGLQSLAMRANLSYPSIKSRTFDWTKNQTAKDGYCSPRNTKDLICASTSDKSRNLTIHQESEVNLQLKKISSFHANEKLAENMADSNKLDSNLVDNNEIDEVESNSGFGSIYNFIKELDKQFDTGPLQIEEKVRVTPDTLDADPNIQMAAEAMEALCYATPPTTNAFSVHQNSDNKFMNSSECVNKKSGMKDFIDSEGTFIGWRNKRKRSRCVKVSAIELNKNTSYPAVGQLKSLNSRNPADATNCKCQSSPSLNVLRQEKFTEREILKDAQNNHCLSESNGCFPGGEIGTREECLKLNLLVYQKRKQARKHVSYHSNGSTKQSSCAAIHENTAEKCSVLNGKSHNREARLLVYSRRHRPASARKHSVNCIDLIPDSSSPTVNNNGSSFRQVHTDDGITAAKLSNQFSKLNDVKSSASPDTLSNTQFDSLSAGNSMTLKLREGSEKSKQKYNLISRSPLMKELIKLGHIDSLPDFLPKDLRKRVIVEKVCILFSQNLDNKIYKQQKKIMARLGLSFATCCSDATHFVADRFVRTRNMLEAIALAKPVVTHLWLESCEQAGYIVNEKSYIMRDEIKEKEMGFSMLASLRRSNQHPLLKRRVVFITPNVKPSMHLMCCLVNAAGGQVIQDVQSVITNKMISDESLILSSEEDYRICVPLLEKGAPIYNSELLLNGIVIQKLEFDRHKLFEDFSRK